MEPAQVVEVRFPCAICGETAGRVQLLNSGEPMTDPSRPALQKLVELDRALRPPGQARLLVETFYGVEGQPVTPENLPQVAKAIEEADAGALYQIAFSYAPFHCPDCAASYCGKHWTWRHFEDDMYSGIEGDCPRGHYNVLTYWAAISRLRQADFRAGRQRPAPLG